MFIERRAGEIHWFLRLLIPIEHNLLAHRTPRNAISQALSPGLQHVKNSNAPPAASRAAAAFGRNSSPYRTASLPALPTFQRPGRPGRHLICARTLTSAIVYSIFCLCHATHSRSVVPKVSYWVGTSGLIAIRRSESMLVALDDWILSNLYRKSNFCQTLVI